MFGQKRRLWNLKRLTCLKSSKVEKNPRIVAFCPTTSRKYWLHGVSQQIMCSLGVLYLFVRCAFVHKNDCRVMDWERKPRSRSSLPDVWLGVFKVLTLFKCLISGLMGVSCPYCDCFFFCRYEHSRVLETTSTILHTLSHACTYNHLLVILIKGVLDRLITYNGHW